MAGAVVVRYKWGLTKTCYYKRKKTRRNGATHKLDEKTSLVFAPLWEVSMIIVLPGCTEF
jgi:hypothetical protein